MNNNINKNNNSGNDSKFVELVVIAIIAVAFVFSLFFYQKGYFNFKNIDLKDILNKIENKKTNDKESDTDNSNSSENEITDQLLINDLTQKIDYLTGYDSSKNNVPAYQFKNNISGRGDFFNNFTDDMKLYTVLSYLYQKDYFTEISFENKTNILISSYINIANVELKQIDASKVNEQYKLYFGSEITNYRSVNNCPKFLYDSNSNIFFSVNYQCEGNSSGVIYSFINKLISKGDYAYAYVNYGSAKLSDYDSKDKYNIYRNFGEKDLFKSNITFEEMEEFGISESNYKSFVEYKFTFKKDQNGNYYFLKVENS